MSDVLPLTRLGYKTTHQIIVDLFHNGILDASYAGKTGRRNVKYRLRENSYKIIKETGLFNGYSAQTIDPKTVFKKLKFRDRERR